MIERDPAQVRRCRDERPEALIVEGDATLDHNLQLAGVAKAKGLVAALSADADNLFVCLSARTLRPDLTIVARAYEEETIPKLERAGADHVVSPNVSSAIRIASAMLHPKVLSFLDIATRSAGLSLRLEQLSVPRGSSLAGRTLMEAGIPQATGLVVIALRKGQAGDQAEFVFNPAGQTRLEPGDDIIVLGKPDQLRALRDYLRG